jgi:hypothetical protein
LQVRDQFSQDFSKTFNNLLQITYQSHDSPMFSIFEKVVICYEKHALLWLDLVGCCQLLECLGF